MKSMKNKIVWNAAVGLILLTAVLACSNFQKATKQEYRKDNLAFTHFSDWKITEDNTSVTEGVETRYLSVEGPSNAVVLMTRFPDAVSMTLEEYARELQTATGEGAKEVTGGYEIVKLGEAKFSPASASIAGVVQQGLVREFDIKALGFPVPHRAEHYLIETGGARWFIVAQASKEDWDKVKNGFQTIFDSLSLSAAADDKGKK